MIAAHAPLTLTAVRKLAALGENVHIEFKRKAAHPDKIVRELIAFANTLGGTLLLGVDDNGMLAGVKYPNEEWLVVEQSLRQHCRPLAQVQPQFVAVTAKKWIVAIHAPISAKRPHRFVQPGSSEVYLRVNDMSVKASSEMTEIIRRRKLNRDVRFTYGPHEQLLMRYLAEHQRITLGEFRKLTGLNRFKASRKLILLVLADVLNITPTAKGDVYTPRMGAV